MEEGSSHFFPYVFDLFCLETIERPVPLPNISDNLLQIIKVQMPLEVFDYY